MFCKECGNDVKEGAKFCPKCGAKMEMKPVPKKKEMKKSGNGKLIVAIVIVSILLVAAVSALIYYLFSLKNSAASVSKNNDGYEVGVDSDNNDEDMTKEKETITENDKKDAEGDVQEETVDFSGENDLNIEYTDTDLEYCKIWGITPYTTEEYSKNLNTYEWLHSSIGQGEVEMPQGISYPANLYRKVIYNEGSSFMLTEFEGSKGSVLKYVANGDILYQSKTLHDLYVQEVTQYYDTEEILYSDKSADDGKFVFTGYTDAAHTYTVYNLGRIMDGTFYQMIVIFPQYTSEEDKNQKNYITECLYRSCGFSGSTANGCRSYQEYVEAEKK